MNITKLLYILLAFIIITMVMGFSFEWIGNTQEGIIQGNKRIENY